MCGINGCVTLRQEPRDIQLQRLRTMNNRIVHRGPDDEGYFAEGKHVAMGMRRLSVIDLETGKQPITNADGSLVIVFNGEIYNYRELRRELLILGVTFQTESDTEVVLYLYEKLGIRCLEKLNGMFAFSIYDKRKNKVIIARDRFGEKPLYYTHSENRMMWASELKSLTAVDPDLKKIDFRSLNLYFALTYVPAPFTIFQQVFKLKAGYYLELQLTDLSISTYKYWDVVPGATATEPVSDYEQAKKQVRELMQDAVEKRMIADVPLGVFLSGGVDSSIVASLMAQNSDKRIKTFSVGYYNPRYDESDRARMLAKHIGSEHYSFMLNYSEILEVMDRVILNYDEPFGDSSCLPTYFVSFKTRKEVTVALTGDGGDEVFGGYNKYLLHNYGKLYRNLLPRMVREKYIKPLFNSSAVRTHDTRSLTSKIRKFVNSVNDDHVTNHINIMALGFQQEQLEKLISPECIGDFHQILKSEIELPGEQDADLLKLARYVDKQVSLEGDMLVKVDRASMLCSLECRAPFLDHRLFEMTYQWPDQFLLSGRNKKKILKDSFTDLVPDGFFNAPKSGFEVPISSWLRHELRDELLDTLSFKNLSAHGLLNIDYVNDLLEEHLLKSMDHSFKLWTIYCFQKWYNNQFNI